MVAAGFAQHDKFTPTSTKLVIKCLKSIFFLLRKKDNIVLMMTQNHTKHVYFQVFNLWKVIRKLEIDSLGWGNWGGLGGANSPWSETSVIPYN